MILGGGLLPVSLTRRGDGARIPLGYAQDPASEKSLPLAGSRVIGLARLQPTTGLARLQPTTGLARLQTALQLPGLAPPITVAGLYVSSLHAV